MESNTVDVNYGKVNGLCQDSNQYEYFGKEHKKMINELHQKFLQYLHTPFSKIVNKKEFQYHVIYGVSKSGKSTFLDQIGNKLSKDNDNLVVSITFNYYSSIDSREDAWEKNEILSRFVLRLLYSLFFKSPDDTEYDRFELKYINRLCDSNIEQLNWLSLVELLEKHNILLENQKLILLVDELVSTGKNGRRIHEDLYAFLKKGLNYKPKIGLILTTLDVAKFFQSTALTNNTHVNSYPVPLLPSQDIDKFISDRSGMRYYDFYDTYECSELFTRLLLPNMRSLGNMCVDEQYLINRNDSIKEKNDKLQNLWTLVSQATAKSLPSKEVVYRGFNVTYDSLFGTIGDKTVGELLFDSILVQPSNNEILSSQRQESSLFLIKPSLINILAYFDANKHFKNNIYGKIMDLILNPTNKLSKSNKSGVIKGGFEFEELHVLFEGLKRNVLFDCGNDDKHDIVFDNKNYKCIKLKLIDIVTEYADFYNVGNIEEGIYLPNVTDVVHFDTLFAESPLDNSSINPNTIYTFKSENPGFDSLMFGFNSNHELIAFFMENKYSFSYNKSMEKYSKSPNERSHKVEWLNEHAIENKHKLLTFDVISKQFGNLRFGGIYHVFISLQQHLGIKKYPIKLDLNGVVILSAGPDLNENFRKFQCYYGPSFLELMSYFRDAKAVMEEQQEIQEIPI